MMKLNHTERATLEQRQRETPAVNGTIINLPVESGKKIVTGSSFIFIYLMVMQSTGKLSCEERMEPSKSQKLTVRLLCWFDCNELQSQIPL